MAVNFKRSTSDYLEIAQAVLTGPPLTMSAWVNSKDADNGQGVIMMSDSTNSTTNTMRLELVGSAAGDPLFARVSNSIPHNLAKTTTGYTVGKWHHVAGRFVASDDIWAYIDGGSEDQGTLEKTAENLNHTAIGMIHTNNRHVFFDGDIAEVAIWNVALTVAEVSMLASGMSPQTIQLDNLAAYWPLIHDYRDYAGTFDLTAGGFPTFSQHPPGISYPPERERLSSKQLDRRSRVM